MKNRREAGTLSDQSEGKYRVEENTSAATACPEDRRTVFVSREEKGLVATPSVVVCWLCCVTSHKYVLLLCYCKSYWHHLRIPFDSPVLDDDTIEKSIAIVCLRLFTSDQYSYYSVPRTCKSTTLASSTNFSLTRITTVPYLMLV